MTYPISLSQPATADLRRVGLTASFRSMRANRKQRVHARRTALAVSEEARINAQMRYRRMRYRHLAS